jgi:hypothetical protein
MGFVGFFIRKDRDFWFCCWIMGDVREYYKKIMYEFIDILLDLFFYFF